MTPRDAILQVCEEVTMLLIDKNKAYGNSAFEPINIFSDLDPVEGIKLRIDDKLKRLKLGHEYQGDDTLLDLIGYLILLQAYKRVDE